MLLAAISAQREIAAARLAPEPDVMCTRPARSVATLHLIVGLPCAGKTTYARQLETERHALRLTPDEWIGRLLGPNPFLDALDAARDPTEAALWDVAERVLTLGIDVILDFGFWGRDEREDYRTRAARLAARSEIHYLAVPEQTLINRLRARNANLRPGTFRIDEERLLGWVRQFEPPSEDEMVPREPPTPNA